MTQEEITPLFTGCGMKVRVKNQEYINGGYEGIILGIYSSKEDGVCNLLVRHPLGSDGYEDIETCEIIS